MKILKNLNFDQSGRVSFTSNGKIIMIVISTILYCEAQGNYTNVHFTDGTSILDSCSLKDMRCYLEEFGFFSIDRSFVINLFYIKSITQQRCPKVALDDSTELKVSRPRKAVLMKILF